MASKRKIIINGVAVTDIVPGAGARIPASRKPSEIRDEWQARRYLRITHRQAAECWGPMTANNMWKGLAGEGETTARMSRSQYEQLRTETDPEVIAWLVAQIVRQSVQAGKD